MTPVAAEEIGALVSHLKWIERKYGGDPEAAHGYADSALLAFIEKVTGTTAVTEAFDEITKWYS